MRQNGSRYFPHLFKKIKQYAWLPLSLMPHIPNMSTDIESAAAHFQHVQKLQAHQARLVEMVTQDAKVDYLLPDVAHPVYPFDSMMAEQNKILNFPTEYADSLQQGMAQYRDQQGYKYFEVAARHNVHDLDIANQRFQSIDAQTERTLRATGVIQSRGTRLTYPVYTKMPKPESMAKSGQEELHRLHWNRALSYASVGYAEQLTKAYENGVVRDATSWSAWNKKMQADSGFIAGSGGHLMELGAYLEQRYGVWMEEHQLARGVNEGRHGTHSDHYAHKYIQTGSDISQALDIFGPERQYGRVVTALLDSIYQHEILPHIEILGVPSAVTDSVKCKITDNYKNPGRAVWYDRGHYGDHIHISMMPRCAADYKGQAYVDQERSVREELTAIFDTQNKKVPIVPYQKKILPPHKNILVYNRRDIVPLDSNYAWESDMQVILDRIYQVENPKTSAQKQKKQAVKKPSPVLKEVKDNASRVTRPAQTQEQKVSFRQNGSALHRQGFEPRLLRRQKVMRADYA
jgi:hypothetical protein